MDSRPLIARIFLWKKFSSFTYLNITQFLITLNDSIFRLLVAYSLIDKLGEDRSSHILFVSGVLFVAPFLIFAMPSGELADKCAKNKVIVWTLVLEMLAMGYGIYAMARCSEWNAYAALFCVALQASIFLPSKYAILPEIVKKEELSKANGFMTLATYMGLILGTFLASFFTQITGNNYVSVAIFCFIIASIAFFTSLQIENTPVKNAAKTIKILFLVQVYKSLKLAKQYPHLLLTVLAGAYFLYTASFTQLNLIPFGIQSLGITDVQAGYVFLAAALGIGIGSLTVALVSGKNVELGISIWGAFGTSISYVILFLFSKSLIIATIMILSLGINGGLYIVPLDAYIQLASPDKDRGEIVAASSFLGFVGVLFAALSLGFFSSVLKISAADGYLIIGLLSLTVSTIIVFFLPEYVSRILAVTLFKAFYQIETKNQPQIDFYETVILIIRKYSFFRVLSMIFLYPRIAFIRFKPKKPFFFMNLFYKLFHMQIIPTNKNEDFDRALQSALEKKMPLCVCLEIADDKRKNEYSLSVDQFLQKAKAPHVFMDAQKQGAKEGPKGILDFIFFRPGKICAHFSEKNPESLTFQGASQKLSQIETAQRGSQINDDCG